MDQQRFYQCERKKAYPDRTSALVAADRLVAKTHSSVVFHAFECRFCHNWHVGRANRTPEAVERNRARYGYAA